MEIENQLIADYIHNINEIMKYTCEEYGECFLSCEIKKVDQNTEIIITTPTKIITTSLITKVVNK
jgi:hypothetical protein